MMNRFWEKVHERKKLDRLPYLAAFLIPLLVCVCICIGNGVYPFGDKCVLHVDMYHQYCPFFTEFLNKLRSGGSLQYSWNLGLGSDFVSLFAYYLASPLNWLIILCPRAYVIEFMTLLILVKIACSGLAFFFYLKESYPLAGRDGRFHSRSTLPALVFAAAYALSGFVAAYSWDIMWLDCVALFPVILVGLKRLVRERRCVLYYVSLALCILANYYISIMICIFLVFCFLLLFLREGRPARGEQRKRWRLAALGRFALYSALAGGTAAVLILPEIAVLGMSGSVEGGFPKQAEWYFNIAAELGRGALSAEVYTGNDHWPNLYAGAFCLVLVWVYLLNRRISWKEKLPRFLMLIFFLVSFANNQLDYIWHGMHFPQSLPGRQSFLYIFLLLSMCYAAVYRWRGVRLWHIVAATVASVGLLLAASAKGDAEVTADSAYIVTALAVVLYGILMLLTKLTGIAGRVIARIGMGIALLELAVNMALTGFSVTSRVSYTEKQKDYQALLALAREREGEGAFFRVEDTGRKTKNDDALYGYASATIFSSLMNLEVSHFYQGLYMEGGKNYYCYNGATPLTSAMLSVKYYLSSSPYEANGFRSFVAQSGDSYLYENRYCLPVGYMVGDEMIESWLSDRQKKIDSLNGLAAGLGADEMITKRYCEQETGAGKTTLTIPEDGYYYAAYNSCSADTLTVARSDGWKQKYSKTTHRYLINLGDCEKGETVTISNSKSEEITFSVYRLNEEAVRQAYDTLNAQVFVVDEVTDRSVRGHIDVTQAGRLVFSIPADEGWSLRVDGKSADMRAWQDAFIGVELSEGEHEVELRYTTPYLAEGAAVSAVCVLIFAFTVFLKSFCLRKEGEML